MRLFLFDLDGTLTDPGIGITNSVMYALKHFGLPVQERAAYYRYIGPPLLDSFSRFEGASSEEAQELLRLYREYYSVQGILENELYDGIPALLEGLKERGVRLSLATSKPEPYALQILDSFGIRGYFDQAACSNMDESRSDKAQVIRYAFELAGPAFCPEQAVMIGDRSHDVIGASVNGVRTAGVTFGYGSRRELKEAGAAWIVDSVQELSALLQRLIDEEHGFLRDQ